MTKKEFAAIQAVLHGCKDNVRVMGKTYMLFADDGEKITVTDTIKFEEAVEIVCNFINKEERRKNGKQLHKRIKI